MEIERITKQINERQKFLGSFINRSAIVVGLGGIGSWVAVDLALLGVGTIYIFDDDVIEASNLNRTLFRMEDIGKTKTEAVRRLIEERRPETIVVPFNEKCTLEDYKELCKKTLPEISTNTWIVDCSDTSNFKEALARFYGRDLLYRLTNYIKLGYDGLEGTISVNDLYAGSWGEDSPYTVVPSFFGTPQILSAMAVMMLAFGSAADRRETWTFNVGLLQEYITAYQEKERKMTKTLTSSAANFYYPHSTPLENARNFYEDNIDSRDDDEEEEGGEEDDD